LYLPFFGDIWLTGLQEMPLGRVYFYVWYEEKHTVAFIKAKSPSNLGEINEEVF